MSTPVPAGSHGGWLSPGIASMAVAALFFSVMGLCVRLLAHLPFMEVVVVRSGLSVLFSLWMLRRIRASLLGRSRGLLLLRGLFGFLGLSAYFHTLHALPLAEAVTIQYTNPLFTALLAPWLLGERGSGREWLAAVTAFAGVALIAQPLSLFGASDAAAARLLSVAIGLGGALCSGIAYTLVRRLGIAGEEPLTIVLYFPLVSLILGAPIAAADWRMPDGFSVLLLLAVGVTTQIAQVALTRGLRAERAARATVLNYLVIAISTIFSWALGEAPSPASLAGIALIAGGITMAAGRPLRQERPDA